MLANNKDGMVLAMLIAMKNKKNYFFFLGVKFLRVNSSIEVFLEENILKDILNRMNILIFVIKLDANI